MDLEDFICVRFKLLQISSIHSTATTFHDKSDKKAAHESLNGTYITLSEKKSSCLRSAEWVMQKHKAKFSSLIKKAQHSEYPGLHQNNVLNINFSKAGQLLRLTVLVLEKGSPSNPITTCY